MFKKLMILFIILLVIWIIILFVNIFRINSYKEPILYSWVLEDESSATYNCLGYKVNTSKIRGIILRANMYFGNYQIFETDKREYEYNPVTDQITIKDFNN